MLFDEEEMSASSESVFSCLVTREALKAYVGALALIRRLLRSVQQGSHGKLAKLETVWRNPVS